MTRRRLGLGIAGVAAAVAVGGLVVVVLVVAGLTVLPTLFRDEIVAWVDAQLDQQLTADVTLGDIDVSLWSSFPRLGVRIHDVRVVNRAPFEGTELFSAAEVGLGLDLLSVVRGDTIRVRRLSLVDPAIEIRVDAQGRSNTEITPDSGTAPAPSGGAAGSTAVRLDDVDVQNLSLRYVDRSSRLAASVEDLDLQARASYSGDVARITSTTSIAALTVRSGKSPLLKDAALDAEVALVYDVATGRAEFGDNRIGLNALGLSFAGTVWPKEAETELDLTFQTADNAFKSLLSLVPAAYGASFAGVEAGGTIAVGGKVQGTYAATEKRTVYPAFDIGVEVRDGSFKFPDLPTGVDRVVVDAKLTHPGGADLDALVVDVPKLGLTAAGAPFDAVLHVEHPLTDPEVAAKAKGVIDLAALRAALPAQAEAAPPSGRIELDVDVAGRASAFQAVDVDAVKAEGRVRGTDVRYVSEGWPDLLVQALDLELRGHTAELHEARVAWGDGSSMSVTGRLEGVVPYLLADDGELHGTVSVRSPEMDLRPFEGGDAEAGSSAPAPKAKGKGKGKGKAAPAPAPSEPGETGEAALVAVPTNVDLVTDLQIGHLVTSSFDMRDVVGAVVVRDGAVRMDPLQATMLGGRVTLEGGYAAPTASRADLDVSVTGIELELDDTLATFETMAAILPVLKGVAGKYDTSLALKLALQPDGTPMLESLASSGMFAPLGSTVTPQAFGAVSSKLGSGFEAVRVGGTKILYEIDDGRIDLEPFAVKLGGAPAQLSGTIGVLDRKLDLAADVSVPTKLLKGAPILGSLGKNLGSAVDVTVRVRGTADAPKVSVAVGGVEDVVDAIVDEVKDKAGEVLGDLVAEARKQGDALVAAAKGEADRLRTEAASAGAKLRSEAKAQGDKLVRDAKGNPLKEVAAKESAKVLATQADKAADKLEQQADAAGDKVVAEATAQKNKLIAEAEQKAKAATR